jgi:hypothetical protein
MAPRKKNLFFACLVIILFSSIASSANAQSLANKDGKNRSVTYRGVYRGTIYDFVVSVDPSPASTVTFSGAELNLLSADFPTWSLGTISPFTWLPGELDVVYYDGGLAEQVDDTLVWEPTIKFDFQVDYINSSVLSIPAGNVIQWIQFVYTNDPIPGQASPALDPTMWNGVKNWEDGLPFYWTLAQNKSHSNIGNVMLRFTDRPARPFDPDAITLGTITWEAHLYLALWDQAHAICVDPDGVKWGFKITAMPVIAEVPKGTVEYTHGGVGGDKYDWIPGKHLNYTAPLVGGYSVLIGRPKPGLPASNFGLVSAVAVSSVATAIYVKSARRRKEKE